MREVLSALAGIISALIVFHDGNFFGSVVFGLFMTAMVWAALYKTPKDSPNNSNTIEVNNTPTPTPTPTTNSQELKPEDVGKLIASSLSISCHLSNMSAAEQSTLERLQIVPEKYLEETLALAGFAQITQISESLKNDRETQKLTLKGYNDAWRDVSLNSTEGKLLHSIYQKRLIEYKAASFSNASQSMLSIGILFSENLAPDIVGVDHYQLAIFGNAIFDAHIEGTAIAIKQSMAK